MLYYLYGKLIIAMFESVILVKTIRSFLRKEVNFPCFVIKRSHKIDNRTYMCSCLFFQINPFLVWENHALN